MDDIKIETIIDKSEARPSGWFTRALQSPLTAAAAIAVITLAVFAHVLTADFVMWDDDIIIYQNPNIRDLSIAHLGKIFTDVDSMMRYNPLTLLGWSITYRCFGANPFWFHLGNWLMHGLNASLVFFVLRKLLVLASLKHNWLNVNPRRITLAAGLSALLWSIHPLRVEPVAWCTDRTYCQCFYFCFFHYCFTCGQMSRTNCRCYILLAISVIFYAASLLSYAIGMTFFLVLIVIDIYLLGKMTFRGRWWENPANRLRTFGKDTFCRCGADHRYSNSMYSCRLGRSLGKTCFACPVWNNRKIMAGNIYLGLLYMVPVVPS